MQHAIAIILQVSYLNSRYVVIPLYFFFKKYRGTILVNTAQHCMTVLTWCDVVMFVIVFLHGS